MSCTFRIDQILCCAIPGTCNVSVCRGGRRPGTPAGAPVAHLPDVVSSEGGAFVATKRTTEDYKGDYKGGTTKGRGSLSAQSRKSGYAVTARNRIGSLTRSCGPCRPSPSSSRVSPGRMVYSRSPCP